MAWSPRAVVFALAIALLSVASGAPVRGQGLATVRVIGPANDGYTPVFVGVKLGIFKKYGLDVQPTIVANGAAAAAALSGGGADVAFTNSLVVIQAHAHNIPLQYLVPGGLTTPQTGLSRILVLKDSPMTRAADLNGKVMASPALHDVNSAIFLAWIDKNGGDAKSLRQIELPPSAAVAFLQEHRADAVMLVEPNASQALSAGTLREFANPYTVLSGPVNSAGYAVLKPAADANRDVYARFAQAMHEACEYVNAHQEDTVDIVAGFTGATPDAIRHSRRQTYPDYLEARMLQPLIDIGAKYGLIDKAFPAADIINSASVKAR
jgi:NitT/TauT family transport system substrate-binding protein